MGVKENENGSDYPPIADYALISDCHCTALVSRNGSIDWCCMPRPDADSCFGRLLDWNKGGYCQIAPTADGYRSERRYLPGTMILETRFHAPQGEVLLYDFFAMDSEASEQARYELVRIVTCVSGEMEIGVEIHPRFDYGDILPHVTRNSDKAYTAIGSNEGLIIRADVPLNVIDDHDMSAVFRLGAGEQRRFTVHYEPPERIEHVLAHDKPEEVGDGYFERTCTWWRNWSNRMHEPYASDANTLRSAIILKSLTYERTGAIIAAPTTSLPEWVGEPRNWDYRFCWVRDSVFTVRALYELGYENEAERFLEFIQRTSAGSAKQLQIMYAVDGKRRLTEIELEWLDGYRGSKPVRIGNSAAKQNQLDIYAEILELATMWHGSGHRIDGQYWNFLKDVVDTVDEKWEGEDYGIWEFRGGPHHYVHSKAMCWSAMDRGIRLAHANGFDAPFARWEKSRDAIRAAIESRGYDSERGVFVQAFDRKPLDAALLLLPRIGFVAYDDPRMIRTVDAICAALERDGLLVRYNAPDGLPGREGAFMPCTFWLVSCLARQNRKELAWQYYRRAIACANEIGLLPEEYDVEHRQMLGNFPQGLTHVSQIMARLALADAHAA